MKKKANRGRNLNYLLNDEYGGERKGSFPGRIGKRLGKIGGALCLKNIFVVALALCGLALSVALIGAASLWLYGKAVTSDFFTTKHIDVAGNVRLSREMVLQYGGLSEGDNSLAISIGDVERNLRETPWVEQATVKRLLPDRFVIKLKERMPSFWVHKDGKLYYANERGEIIAPVESENFLSLPTLQIMPGAEDIVPALEKLLKDAQAGTLPIEAGSIASVTLSPSNGVEIFLEDREMRLAIAADDWERNMARLGVALGDLAKRRELSSAREARAVDGNVWIIMNGNVRSPQ